MLTILNNLRACLAQDQMAVMCTIVESSGSAPRGSGARMLVCGNDRLFGTIGGGELEGRTLAKARELLRGGPGHALLRFDLTSLQAAIGGMICGGAVQILLQRLEPESETVDFFQDMAESLDQGKSPVLLTMMPQNHSPQLLMYVAGNRLPALPPELLDELLSRTGKTSMPFCLLHGETKLHAEPLSRPLRLHLAGAGHVSLATARLADFLGLEVTVIDDRPEFANHERFPMAREVKVIDSFRQCLAGLDANDYVVIVTRGHLYDQQVLSQALRTDAGYIGMIASRRKRDTLYAALRRDGFSDQDLLRVHSPIGLPIGGESPEEIALSIMAEIQQFRYMKTE